MKKLTLLLATIYLMNISIAEEKVYHATPFQAIFSNTAIIENEELSNVVITQTLSQSENPNQATITVIQSGLLDDSIGAIKTEFVIDKSEEGWTITSETESHQCRRSENKDAFTTERCL